MKYRTLPGIPHPVSPLCLGTQEFSQNEGWWGRYSVERCGRILAHALAAGVNFIDTAEMYGDSESILGELLAGRRDQVVLTSKLSRTDWDYPTARERLEGSLQRLRTDHLDLYLLHWPKPDMSPEDGKLAFETLRQLKEDGLIRAAGVSNFQLRHLRQFPREAFTLIIVNQVPFNLLWRTFDTPEHVAFCREVGLLDLSYASLAQGLLTGHYSDPSSRTPIQRGNVLFNEPIYARAREVVDLVSTIARELGASPAQVALRWVLDRESIVSALVGIRTIEELEENLGALQIQLAPAQRAALDAASAEFCRPIPTDLRLWIPDNEGKESLLEQIGQTWKPWSAYQE